MGPNILGDPITKTYDELIFIDEFSKGLYICGTVPFHLLWAGDNKRNLIIYLIKYNYTKY